MIPPSKSTAEFLKLRNAGEEIKRKCPQLHLQNRVGKVNWEIKDAV